MSQYVVVLLAPYFIMDYSYSLFLLLSYDVGQINVTTVKLPKELDTEEIPR
jgi:hypothetical protein